MSVKYNRQYIFIELLLYIKYVRNREGQTIGEYHGFEKKHFLIHKLETYL